VVAESRGAAAPSSDPLDREEGLPLGTFAEASEARIAATVL